MAEAVFPGVFVLGVGFVLAAIIIVVVWMFGLLDLVLASSLSVLPSVVVLLHFAATSGLPICFLT